MAGEYPSLARMLRVFASRGIRNRATMGGNLATASPIGDSAPVLLSLDASLVLASAEGERTVPISRVLPRLPKDGAAARARSSARSSCRAPAGGGSDAADGFPESLQEARARHQHRRRRLSPRPRRGGNRAPGSPRLRRGRPEAFAGAPGRGRAAGAPPRGGGGRRRRDPARRSSSRSTTCAAAPPTAAASS